MTSSHPSVTVVICSVGRPDALELCIDGLRRLEDVSFEIAVVLGPGAATSVQDLRGRSEIATVVSSPVRNLSLSRNLGADAARGELIAFIDDDAYPSERWLADLSPAFADPEVGAVGGETFDYTGHTHQAIASLCTIAGDSHPILVQPTRGLTETPVAESFYYPIGTNLVVRAEALRSIGGFDEQFDYFHDESDLARRLLDAGWIVRPLPRGHVFHKFLPSAIRGERRIATDRRSIVTNRAYFAARHQAPRSGPIQVRSDFEVFADSQEEELTRAESLNQVPEGTLERFTSDRAMAAELLEAWLIDPPAQRRHLPDPSTVVVDRTRVINILGADVRHVAVISPDGLATSPIDVLVPRLVDAGCRVHVIEHSSTHTTVDLEDGLWRHRISTGPGVDVLAGDGPLFTTLVDEATRIDAGLVHLDAVVADHSSLSNHDIAMANVVDADTLVRCSSAPDLLEMLRHRRPDPS